MAEANYKAMRLCILGIIPFFIFAGTSWGVLAFNIPPFDAATPAEELAAHFREHGLRLRIAYGVAVPSWAFIMVWSVGIFSLMRRIEGKDGIYSYLQLMGGSLTCLAPTFASVFWLTAALRPERDPALTQLLYDMGWLTIDMIFLVTTIQYVAMGIVFLKDKRTVPLIPKWISWLGIWVGIEFFAEIIMPNFRSGPFSWAGLFNYWIPFFAPFGWMSIVSFAMIRAINRLEQEDASNLKPAAS